MSLRTLRWLSVIVVVGMALAAWAVALRLPADARLPVHWNAFGEIDRWTGAVSALAVPVATAAFLTLIFSLLPAIEPLQKQMEKSMALYGTAWLATLGIMVLLEVMIALPAFGRTMPGGLLPVAVGLLFILVGNVLPKSRPSFFAGIRTPWTLSDPENWIATHRLGGRTMMLGGAMLLASPLLPMALRGWLLVAAVIVAAVPPLVYSWWFWRRRQRQG